MPDTESNKKPGTQTQGGTRATANAFHDRWRLKKGWRIQGGPFQECSCRIISRQKNNGTALLQEWKPNAKISNPSRTLASVACPGIVSTHLSQLCWPQSPCRGTQGSAVCRTSFLVLVQNIPKREISGSRLRWPQCLPYELYSLLRLGCFVFHPCGIGSSSLKTPGLPIKKAFQPPKEAERKPPAPSKPGSLSACEGLARDHQAQRHLGEENRGPRGSRSLSEKNEVVVCPESEWGFRCSLETNMQSGLPSKRGPVRSPVWRFWFPIFPQPEVQVPKPPIQTTGQADLSCSVSTQAKHTHPFRLHKK